MLIISDMDTNDKDDSYADIIMNITNRILIMLLYPHYLSASPSSSLVITHRSSSLIIIIIIIVIVHSLYPLCLTLRDIDIDIYSYIIIIS